MPHYDRLETRSPASRENALFRDLRAVLGMAKSRAPALRNQLRNIDIDAVKSRADLAKIPLLRREDIVRLQSETPPLGGMNAARLVTLRALYADSHGVIVADGHSKDWWGGARAFYAAGFRKGDIILNACSYHLKAEGHMVECGLKSLGAVAIPAGLEQLEAQVAMLKACPAQGYVGPLAHLNRLLASGAKFRHVVITGSCLTEQRRQDLTAQGISVAQIYMTPETGIIAYESPGNGILVINEGLIVEIVDPATGKLLPQGEYGEVVVTRIKTDLPLLRFATGDLAAFVEGPNLCGRTNARLIFHSHHEKSAIPGAGALAFAAVQPSHYA